jgi:gas vesicle protein
MQEYPDFSENEKGSAKIGPFVIGAMLGAGVALLLAPAHGRETRRRFGSSVKPLGTNAKPVIDRARGGMDDLKNDAKSAMDKGRQEYSRSRTIQTPGV